MLAGCINGIKSEENRYFTLKTSKITAYLHAFGLSFTWVCSVKALRLPANLNAFAQKTCVEKDWKADDSTQRIDTHDITKTPHISRIYNKQGCCSQIRQRWRGVCQEKWQFTFCFEHGGFGSAWWSGYGVVGAWFITFRHIMKPIIQRICWYGAWFTTFQNIVKPIIQRVYSYGTWWITPLQCPYLRTERDESRPYDVS